MFAQLLRPGLDFARARQRIEFVCQPDDKGVIAEPVPAKSVLRAAYLGQAAEDWHELELRVRPHLDYVRERITEVSASA